MSIINIRTTKAQGSTCLYFYICVRKNTESVRVWQPTPISVDIEKWNAYKQMNRIEDYIKKLKCGNEILRLELEIKAMLKHGNVNLDTIRKMINETLNAKAVKAEEEIKARLEAAAAAEEQERLRKEQERIRKKNNVLNYTSKLIDRLESGECLSRKGVSKRLDANTIKTWRGFYKVLSKFYNGDKATKLPAHKFEWNDIDRKLCMQFRCFLESEGYLLKTIAKYITTFAALVNYANDDAVHTNVRAASEIRKVKPIVGEEDKVTEIYLTTDELQALYEMPLSGTKEQVRDLFLIGCYTCQRFSDYSRIKSNNITKSYSGKYYQITLRQEKTGNKVTIPLLNDNVKNLLAKYDNNVPRVSDIILNRYIKEILKELSQSVPTLAEEHVTKLTMKDRIVEAKGEVVFNRDDEGNALKPRYNLVSSHTARRSGITNLYKTGLFDTYQMMSISGHKDIKTFREYIKLSGDEIAESIAKAAEINNIDF